jgi:hypothetical protein
MMDARIKVIDAGGGPQQEKNTQTTLCKKFKMFEYDSKCIT